MTSTEHAAGGDAAAVAPFIDKWRAREPEMAFADVFCPRDQRMRFALWGALLFEWREAAFELSDVRPTEAKCAWWADEAMRCAQSAPRHPLTIALAAPTLPWNALTKALLAMSQSESSRPQDRDDALASVASLAYAIAAIEGALFDAKPAGDAQQAVAVHLLCERLRVGIAAVDGGRIPLSLLARHGITSQSLLEPQGEPALRDWARELASAMPSNPAGASLYRCTRAAFDRWHLQALATGRRKPMASLRAVLLAWGGARQARRTG